MSSYWELRSQQNQKRIDLIVKATLRRIGRAYDNAIKQAFHDGMNVISNYTSAFDLTQDEAKKLLLKPASPKDIALLKERLKAVNDACVKKQIQAQISAEAYSARLNKLNLIKITARAGMARASEAEERLSYSALKQAYKLGFNSSLRGLSAYLGHQEYIKSLPDARIKEVLYTKWSGKNFSQRIWSNSRLLSGQVEQALTELFTSGKVTRQSYLDLIKNAEGSKLAANRLLRTETTYVTSKSTIDAYRHAGVKKYRFSAVNDLRTSEICEEHDGRIYSVDAARPGVNLPPLHPFCRSSIEPVFERGQAEEEALHKAGAGGIMGSRDGISVVFAPADAEAIAEYQAQSDVIVGHLTLSENLALQNYTSDGYAAINAAARGEISDSFLLKQVDLLNAVMARFELRNNLTVYRSDNSRYYTKYAEGDIFKPNMFYSTSVNKAVAKKFGLNMGKDLLIEIGVPKGTQSMFIGNNSEFADEQELLLSSKLNYKVTYKRGRLLRVEVVADASGT